jgi:hypothetical protein
MAQNPSKIREFQKRFPDEDSCLTHLMRSRYGERFTCFKCLKEATYYRVSTRRCFVCEHCGYQVYPTAGTPFEKTRTSLRDWFYIMFLFCETRNGVAAKEVQRQLGVTYKTAWRMCHMIRLYMGYVDGDAPIGGPGKTVEADETFIGGLDHDKPDDKAIVLGMIERGGDVVTRVVQARTKAHIVPHIVRFVKEGRASIWTKRQTSSCLPRTTVMTMKRLTIPLRNTFAAMCTLTQSNRSGRRLSGGFRGLTFGFRRSTCSFTFASSSIAITCAVSLR